MRAGLPEPYLVGINSWSRTTDCRALGFDTTLDYEPQLGDLAGSLVDGVSRVKLRRNLRLGVRSARLKVFSYEDARRLIVAHTDLSGRQAQLGDLDVDLSEL